MHIERLVDWGERVILILLSIPFLFQLSSSLLGQPYNLLFLVSTLVTIVLVIIRKPGQIVAKPYTVFVALAGTALPLFSRPHDVQVIPTSVGVSIMFVGLALSIAAKLYLNRSFGVVAANRGAKQGGPYRLVRHPMYLGYVICEVGFILLNFSLFNMVVFAFAWMFQILRIREEEAFLVRDPEYVDFTLKTRWRILPGLY